MLEYYVKKIFDNRDIALSLSENAKRHARELYNPKKNYDQLISIYRDLGRKNHENCPHSAKCSLQ